MIDVILDLCPVRGLGGLSGLSGLGGLGGVCVRLCLLIHTWVRVTSLDRGRNRARRLAHKVVNNGSCPILQSVDAAGEVPVLPEPARFDKAPPDPGDLQSVDQPAVF